MTIDEQARHLLFQRLDEVLGRDEAATLMSHLPPVGRSDVATRHDVAVLSAEVDQFRADVDRRFHEVDRRFEEIDRRFNVMDRRFDEAEQRFDHKLDDTRHHLESTLDRSFRRLTATMMWVNLGQLVALGGLLLAAVTL